nr:MAG: putative RNA-dependent RNA polymerase [Totiviridae sp.]
MAFVYSIVSALLLVCLASSVVLPHSIIKSSFRLLALNPAHLRLEKMSWEDGDGLPEGKVFRLDTSVGEATVQTEYDINPDVLLPIRVDIDGISIGYVAPSADDLANYSTIASRSDVGSAIVLKGSKREHDVVAWMKARRPIRAEEVRVNLGVSMWEIVNSDLIALLPSADYARCCRVKERAVELGRIGFMFLQELKIADLFAVSATRVDALSITARHTEGQYLRACAISILCCAYPIQVPHSKEVVRRIANAALFKAFDASKEPIDLRLKENRKEHFPLKKNPGARNKTNVYLDEVWKSAVRAGYSIAHDFQARSGELAGRLSDDQAAGCLMLACAYDGVFDDPLGKAMCMVLRPDIAKNLNVVIKSLGLNGTLEGAMLCEGVSMQGRGGNPRDVREDWEYRLSHIGVATKTHSVDDDSIREAVREIISLELPDRVEFPTLEEHWGKRWLWCVNGTHSKSIERLYPQFTIVDKRFQKGEVHRRVFSENIAGEPITAWSGKSYFNLSLKLENGKTRTIYSGDTITYFAFDHLLSTVEKVWMGRRVILNPGVIGTYGMHRRIRRMHSHEQGIHVMLDYEDFNARHTIAYQKIVFEELCRATAYDEALGRKLIDSFDNMYLKHPDSGAFVKLMGTLMSGHRATSFVNSVLNYAYVRAVYPALKNMSSMHVGDDVYVRASNYGEAFELLHACKMAGLAMNPIKQSVGSHTAEFLRVAYTTKHCCGYLCRCISACICGNWIGELKLSKEEGLQTIVSHAWTISNRSNDSRLPLLLYISTRRMARVGGRLAEGLLDGTIGLGNGPSRYRDEHSYRAEVTYVKSNWEKRMEDELRNMGSKATTDYLNEHCHPIERFALGLVSGNIQTPMLKSSYSKTIAGWFRDEEVDKVRRVRVYQRPMREWFEVDNLWNLKIKRGVLTRYPLLNLIKGAIETDVLADLVDVAGGNSGLTGTELYEHAWGESYTGSAFRGRMSYGDASLLSKKCNYGLIETFYSCFV